MPVINSIAAMEPEMREWRHWLHRNPELQFDLPKTAAFVAGKLRDFGVDEICHWKAELGGDLRIGAGPYLRFLEVRRAACGGMGVAGLFEVV